MPPRSEGRRAAYAKPFKPLQTILEQETEEAEAELARPALGLMLSSLLAGIGVGFSMLMAALLHARLEGEAPAWLLEIVVANAYTVGFILVIVARTDLFTEYTTIAILPVISGRASMASLARLWGLVYGGNLLGTAVIAAVVAAALPVWEASAAHSLGVLSRRLVDHSGWTILLSGLLAGWLMGLLSWLVTAGRETVSQILLIWLVTGVIGYSHLHHAITGSAELLAAIFAGQGVRPADYGRFLLWTTLGNALGGIAFAALIHPSALIAEEKTARGPSAE